MNDKKEKVNYMNQLFISLIAVLFTAFISISLQYIGASFEHAKLIVSGSIKMNNEYYTNISIKNYKNNTSLNDLNICISNDLNVLDVISQFDHPIENNIINVNSIQPLETLSIILLTDKMIDSDDITVDASYSVDADNINDYRPVSAVLIISVIISAFIYGIAFFTANVLSEKRRLKSDREWKATLKSTKIQVKDLQNSLTTLSKNFRRFRFYHLRRNSDLSKELRFWRDTIRKLLYTSKSDNISDEVIFRTVTSSLKTFTVNERSNDELENIFTIAEAMVNDKDKTKSNSENIDLE